MSLQILLKKEKPFCQLAALETAAPAALHSQ